MHKVAFQSLLADKEQIEKEFGEPLDWQELPGKKATRIALFKNDVDPSSKDQYPQLHSWMLAKMDRFRQVFAARVRSLPAGSLSAPEQAAEPVES